MMVFFKVGKLHDHCSDSIYYPHLFDTPVLIPIVRPFSVGAWRSPVSAPVWGTGGRGFKSRRPDQLATEIKPLWVTGSVERQRVR